MELKIDNLELSKQATTQIVKGVLTNIEPLVKKHLNLYNAKEYLTLGETAEYLSISRGSLSNLIKDGLPVIKIGKLQKIKKSDLEKYLDQYKN
ncbi:helix-turn-helix domain-containing protein [Vagococcus salmoninarum]|uniref:helix-turn-helix domain-containing protein n=1 Tax=Vagococcus salmoninarum TaxID=2739 RepID=UPI003F95E8B4